MLGSGGGGGEGNQYEYEYEANPPRSMAVKDLFGEGFICVDSADFDLRLDGDFRRRPTCLFPSSSGLCFSFIFSFSFSLCLPFSASLSFIDSLDVFLENPPCLLNLSVLSRSKGFFFLMCGVLGLFGSKMQTRLHQQS